MPDRRAVFPFWEADHAFVRRITFQESFWAVSSILPSWKRVEALTWEAVHIFTHLEWHMTGWRISCAAAPGRFTWTGPAQRAEQYPVPAAFRAYKVLL